MTQDPKELPEYDNIAKAIYSFDEEQARSSGENI
jgi:hypothetical protein